MSESRGTVVNRTVVGAVVAAGATVAGLVFGLAPAAMAADGTGFDSVACAEASVRVQTAAEAAVKAGDELAKANAAILAGLQASLADAEKDQAAKLKVYQDAVADAQSTADEIAAAAKALADAQLKVQQAAKALEDAAPPSVLKDKLVAAQADLKAAIDRRITACDVVVLPTVTVTPSPSVTVTATPRPRVTGIDTGLA